MHRCAPGSTRRDKVFPIEPTLVPVLNVLSPDFADTRQVRNGWDNG
jgi:hypothetical protein